MRGMQVANPLNMRQLGEGGLFVLPPQEMSVHRKQYFERSNRLLCAYSAIIAYSGKGQEAVNAAKQAKAIAPDTPARVKIGQYILQTSMRRLDKMFSTAGQELTRQFLVAVYGNFEAFLADHVVAAFSEIADDNPEQEAIRLMGMSRWSGKLDRIAQKFELRLRAAELRSRYAEVDMGFYGRQFTDPIEFLQAVADLRHRIVHSSGRVDRCLLGEYPECGMKQGGLFVLPIDLPYALSVFLVPLTDELDRLFCERFGWTRKVLRPEVLL